MRITALMLAMRQLPSLLCVKTLGKDSVEARGEEPQHCVSVPGLRGSKSAAGRVPLLEFGFLLHL